MSTLTKVHNIFLKRESPEKDCWVCILHLMLWERRDVKKKDSENDTVKQEHGQRVVTHSIFPSSEMFFTPLQQTCTR